MMPIPQGVWTVLKVWGTISGLALLVVVIVAGLTNRHSHE